MKTIHIKNLPARILLAILVLIPIIYFKEFYHDFYSYLTGNILFKVITNQWYLVILSILIFMAFLIPLSYRRKANWVEYGLVTSFFVSLFVEMYGFPLTILFASKYFFTTGADLPNYLINFHFLGYQVGMDIGMVYGAVLIAIGTTLILVGWITLYRNVKKKKGLVTDGIYSYSRHPQYVGFILVIFGWFFGWPTILTLIFTPILIYKYVRLCKTEEKEVQEKFPEYEAYKARVPFLI